MSPTTGIAASQLKQLIYYHLDNEMVDNANFLAGRLHALEPRNPDTSHLLALTYFRSQRFKAAYDFSQKYGANGRHLGCAYIFAQSCLQLGRHMEGVTALEKAKNAWLSKNDWNKHSETSRRHLPDASAVLSLLARLFRAHGDLRKAGDCYIESHKCNPFIWDSFEGLCKIGADLKVENMFKPTHGMPGAVESSSASDVYVDADSRHPPAAHSSLARDNLSAMDDPFTSSRGDSEDWQNRVKGKSTSKSISDWDTPINDNIVMADVNMDESDVFMDPPAAPPRRPRLGQQFETSDRSRIPASRGHTDSVEPPEDLSQAPRKPSVGGQKRTISGAAPQTAADSLSQPRRSNRLFTQETSTRTTRSAAARADRTARTARPATGTKGRTGIVGRVVSGNRKMMPPDEKEKEKERRAASRNTDRNTVAHTVPGVTAAVQLPPPTGPTEAELLAEKQAMSSLLDNFRQLALGANAASKFDLQNAITHFRTLPTAQRETPWVLAQLGKVYYEQAEYRQAEDCFDRLIKMQPSRIEDMEIYSTVLWHLKKESTLAFLCRVLRDNHFDAPQTWVAVGNAFSLSREHDQAISAFKRATQLDGKFAYAWTLMGHEYIANEAFDAALSCFRQAVAADRRLYNGWFGLGKCFQQMGKLEEAERHYRIAASINPSNPTLLVCIGVVLERLRNKKGALANYSKALELAPGQALARFKKARVLMHMKYYDEALDELQTLRDQAPDEANVWFLLGKCHKGLQDRAEALRAFTTALNLDAKAAPFIKEAMEALDEDDEDSDEE
ncbi:Protein bimA [Pseudocercospora fuligena]|uniref:Protein bimA n=1 Tax=Pseudocercospora fuligena TaxID=685502 RepID=A0A8H6VCE6_9PEZI|nr:Protein bimA [Pseudocercospora fuligena]